MADNRNYAALEWVVGEIEETLKQAQQALEVYVETPEDSTRIRFCLTHIHQVHGSLQMVEFAGAALLAQEMEGLAQALMDHKTVNETEALEVLMRAILQLPVYLEQAKAIRKDEPTTLLPLLNDLRAVRGQRLLSETRLFSPDLSAAKQVRGSRSPALKNPNLKAMLQKLRQMYQYAAAGYIRNVNAEENLAYILKVSDRVAKLTTGTPRYPLWEIMLAVGEALQQGTLQPSVAFKVLLRKLDKELKALAIGGIAAFEGFNSEALTKNFLYYVSSSESVTPRAQALREKYGIEQALPETDFTSSAQSLMDPDAMETVVAALKDEMETVKHALDIGISGSDHAAVEEALPVMQRVADTLEILGVGELRQQVLKQIESLNQYAGGQEPPADLLMKIASEMLGM
ncbi:MAG: Hpt domain-containing protein, partial [Pseudomonadota bacterium]